MNYFITHHVSRFTLHASLITFLLALAGGLSRGLFVRTTPINWDAVQFALAVEEFDLRAHQPHPPGYILYVLAGRVLNLLVGDASLSLTLLSVGCSAVLVPLVYWLALLIFDDKAVALGAALLTLASPLALYYGSVGLTYMPEMILGVGIGTLAWKLKTGAAGATIIQAALLGVALGLAGGTRQTSLLVLLPLCVWALWGARRKALFMFAISLPATCALWLVPLLVMSGGFEAYLLENALLAERTSGRTSIFTAGIEGLIYNLTFEGLALASGLAFGAIPLGLWATRTLRFSLAPGLRAFLSWWALPPIVFYAISHFGQDGYMLVALPPLVLLSAICLRVLAHRLAGLDTARWTALASAVLSALSMGYFLLAQGPITLSNIDRNDAHWRVLRANLNSMDPSNTALIMSVEWAGPFRLAGYLLPDFHAYAAEVEPGQPAGWLYSAYGGRSTYALPRPTPQPYLSLPEGTTRVVGLDDATGAMLAREKGLRRVSLQDGSTLYILDSAPAIIEGLTIQEGTIRVVRR